MNKLCMFFYSFTCYCKQNFFLNDDEKRQYSPVSRYATSQFCLCRINIRIYENVCICCMLANSFAIILTSHFERDIQHFICCWEILIFFDYFLRWEKSEKERWILMKSLTNQENENECYIFTLARSLFVGACVLSSFYFLYVSEIFDSR